MTPHTATSLEQVLKEVWNEQVFKKAFDLEVQGGLNDMRQQAHRQFTLGSAKFTTEPGSGVRADMTPTWVSTPPLPSHLFDMSPRAVHARKARQDQMVRQLAARKRGNKPSYRQRQKNGRAGRK